ncbi:FN3 associated domain-containing protein [Bifidobacterium callitrichidarum]|uniref:Peptidase M60 domain-containing protein n=1 Tax=Bifidobacterium callitrichidarum TaxID=2052941 RepID=A0A2U2NBV7_9BIFI|nr:FN3 associated domain-containing protein [Bifidobacterium callitrichidarum]PWG66636.1 hypothetical protein DF196_01675 [Bifidobacterium callitrichidarum]
MASRISKILALSLTVATLSAGFGLQPAVANETNQQQETAATADNSTSQPTTIKLSTVGSKDTDKNRTYQYFQFENADWTGYYIRPGITAKFKITLTTDSTAPNVLWAHRQAGRVDANNYALVRMDDGGKLKAGENEITYDTTSRKVGQVLYIRNDSTSPASVTIENMDGSDGKPSLGRYPFYVYDSTHPEAFWTYLQELRIYVQDGVDTKAGDLNDNPSLGMDVTSIETGRMVYELRAAKLVDVLKDIQDETAATAWITNIVKVSENRLSFFDHVQGFDAADTDSRQLPSKMKVVLELTQNLTSPSSMFAWYTMYHLPESVFPGVATSVDGSHGWGNDHEFGHVLDIQPLAQVESTNNLFSMWGRHEVGAEKVKAGGKFETSVYHSGVLNAQKQLDAWFDAKMTDPSAASKWGDIWWDVTSKWEILRYFDDYDYSTYDFTSSPYTKELADQVNKYGGLGAVYRQVRRNVAAYRVVGDSQAQGMANATAKAYSDALGFDMSEVLERYGATIYDEVKAYTAKYPKLPVKIQYFSIDAEARGMNDAGLFSKTTVGPDVTAKRLTDGKLSITAAYPTGSGEAATVSGYELLANGSPIHWSPTGSFTIDTPADSTKYTVIAYDRRANPSQTTNVVSDTTVQIKVLTADDTDPSKATVTVTPDDSTVSPTTTHTDSSGNLTLKNIPSSTITVTLNGYSSEPKTAHVDGYDWAGGVLQFTLIPDHAANVRTTPRPTITGTTDSNGNLAFTIIPENKTDDVYYTVDGSTPSSENGYRWNGTSIPINTSPLTVKAIAYRAGYKPSSIAEATFTDNRQVTIWNQIYGPSYGSGQKKSFGVGTYEAADLDFLTDKVSSLSVPSGLKVTIYEGPNLTGATHVYTQTVNWVNGYNPIKSQSMKIETVTAPDAKKTGTVSFQPGADDATGTMNPVDRYEGISMSAPDIAYKRTGFKPLKWTAPNGNAYTPGSLLPDGNLVLTADWLEDDKQTPVMDMPSAGSNESPSWRTAVLLTAFVALVLAILARKRLTRG